MGREVQVGIYDKQENTFNLDIGFICGRTDFTDELYTLFINREKEFLIMDIYGDGLNGVIVRDCKDVGEETSIDEPIEAMFIEDSFVNEIVDDHIKEVIRERERQHSRVVSLEHARDNVRTLKDWLDMDTFLDELKEDEKDLNWSRQEDLQAYLTKAKLICEGKQHNNAITQDKITHRFFPIILFSD